jgi:hypothetical protein
LSIAITSDRKRARSDDKTETKQNIPDRLLSGVVVEIADGAEVEGAFAEDETASTIGFGRVIWSMIITSVRKQQPQNRKNTQKKGLNMC